MNMTKIGAILAAIVIGGGMHAFAQSTEETPDQKPPPPPMGDKMRGPREAMKERFLKSLPPEARKRFEAAREKALQDPKIQELRQKSEAANREFFEAMREKMQEIDPGLAELIKDHAPGRPERPERPDKSDRREGGKPPLTEAEKDQLDKARATAKEDPAVVAAQKKKDEATDPEARRAAGEEHRAAMRAAMIKADPSVEEILKKLGPPAPPPPPGPARGDQTGPDPE